MAAFREFFTAPVWDHVLVMVTGAVLTTGKRAVSAVLRVMGLSQSGDFARCVKRFRADLASRDDPVCAFCKENDTGKGLE